MKPVNSKRELTSFNYDKTKGLFIEFVLTDSVGGTISSKLFRYYEDPQKKLARTKATGDGLNGELFTPDTGEKYPGIILLGGSNGGSVDWLAKAIAHHGFSVLDLPYFKYPGLPDKLVDIPVEYFLKAVAWMKKQPQVKNGKIGLVGGSRGAELASCLDLYLMNLRQL